MVNLEKRKIPLGKLHTSVPSLSFPRVLQNETEDTSLLFLQPDISHIRTLQSWEEAVDTAIKRKTDRHYDKGIVASDLIYNVFISLNAKQTRRVLVDLERIHSLFSTQPKIVGNHQIAQSLSLLDLTDIKAQNKTLSSFINSLSSLKISRKDNNTDGLNRTMLFLLLVSQKPFSTEYSSIFSDRYELEKSLSYVERFAEYKLAQEVVAQPSLFSNVDKDALNIFWLLQKGFSVSEILTQVNTLSPTAEERRKIAATLGQLSFRYRFAQTFSREKYIKEKGIENILTDMDILSHMLVETSRKKGDTYPFNLKAWQRVSSMVFARKWLSLSKEEKEHILNLSLQKDGTAQVSRLFDVSNSIVRTFLKSFYDYEISTGKTNILPSQGVIYPRNGRNAEQNQYTNRLRFSRTITFVKQEPYLRYILPTRIERLLECMTVYIDAITSHAHTSVDMYKTIGKELALESTSLYALIHDCEFFGDLINCLRKYPPDEVWNSPSIHALKLLHFVDYAREKLGK